MNEPTCTPPIPPEARCPNCAAFTLDEAGLRRAFCANCGRCAHPSTHEVGGVTRCDACGKVFDMATNAKAN